jgi:Cu2+-containing amine oxidase
MNKSVHSFQLGSHNFRLIYALPIAPRPRLLAGAILTAIELATRVFGAAHPLEPLSTNELRAAVEVLLKENKISTNTLLPMVTLREPPKEKVLSWETVSALLPREAFVTAYELATHRT